MTKSVHSSPVPALAIRLQNRGNGTFNKGSTCCAHALTAVHVKLQMLAAHLPPCVPYVPTVGKRWVMKMPTTNSARSSNNSAGLLFILVLLHIKIVLMTTQQHALGKMAG